MRYFLDDHNWNVRVLDPCCGSGLFLVKAFQRIIYRWLLANGREPLVSDLKPILANNLVGVDRNSEAARVASFSLYLAMADAIEPKHYVTRTGSKVFPQLRGRRILAQDFFDETTGGIRTVEDAKQYDLVIGNAPWGDGSINSASATMSGTSLTKAKSWAKSNGWPISNNDIGPLFLAKATSLVTEGGRVAMLQNGALLSQRGGPAADLRRKLFRSYTFDEITNLSALRRSLFSSAIGPSCIVVLSRVPTTGKMQFGYIAPKSADRQRDDTILVEPYDVAYVSHDEAASDPYIWTILALGGPRDLQLIRKLLRFKNLDVLEDEQKVLSKSGIIPGDQKQELKQLRGVPFFPETKFPSDILLQLESQEFPPWNNPRAATTYATNPQAFRSPQLLVKLVPDARTGRFRAVRVASGTDWGVVCKKSFLSVHDYSKDAKHIDRACIAYNSDVAAYFLHLTSSRGLYNSEMLLKDLRSVPIPEALVEISSFKSFEEIDKHTHREFGLTNAEKVLIEDFLQHTLPDALRKGAVPGRSPTHRMEDPAAPELELSTYAQTFGRVVKATFGANRSVATTILTEPSGSRLPVRMLSLELSAEGGDTVHTESIEADGLLDLLSEFHKHQLSSHVANSDGRAGFQRVMFLLQMHQGHLGSMSLTIVKPDEVRYWTRSMAMRDADQLAGAILGAANQYSPV